MNKKILLFSILFFASTIISIGVGSYIYIQREINTPLDGGYVMRKEFVVEKGEGVKQISTNLEIEGLIRGAGFFQIYVWRENLASKVQAGKYELSSSMSIPEIAAVLSGGKIKYEDVWITIPEGFLSREIDRRIAESGLLREGEFVNAVSGFDVTQFDFLSDRPNGAGLEGYFFPDTYKFTKGATTDDIMKKMLDNFGKKLTPELRDQIGKQGKTIFKTVILASIIEKEAGSKEDMGKISSVFHNRLNAGYKLESDATVNYVIGKGRAQATYEDIEVNSPFNTYVYAGLPPAPIANPGMDAIKAAIYPETTEYYYFLTKKDTNEAVFSKTYEEHLLNKAKYLK